MQRLGHTSQRQQCLRRTQNRKPGHSHVKKHRIHLQLPPWTFMTSHYHADGSNPITEGWAERTVLDRDTSERKSLLWKNPQLSQERFMKHPTFSSLSATQQEGSALASPAAQTKAWSRNNALRRWEEGHMQAHMCPLFQFTCSGLSALKPLQLILKAADRLKPQTPGSARATNSSENALFLHTSATPERVSKPLCGQESRDHYHSVGKNHTQSIFFMLV